MLCPMAPPLFRLARGLEKGPVRHHPVPRHDRESLANDEHFEHGKRLGSSTGE